MHTFLYRVNAVLTFAVTILAFMCALASFSDNFNFPSPSAQIQVTNFNWFQKQPDGNDEEVGMCERDWGSNNRGFCPTRYGLVFCFKKFDPEVSRFFHNTSFLASLGLLIEALKMRKNVDRVMHVSLTMNITADLLSLFTWNTKQVFIFVAAEYETPQNSLNQVSLWDAIIPAKEHSNFWIQTANKYRFIDQGSNLRGKEFNLTLHWHVMPKTGKMFADKLVLSGFRLPEEYR